MASNRVKGITIEIDGDSSKLQDALKESDKAIRNTSSNLRDINKLLKLDPGNTELLAQKQKNLQSAISATKDKLTQLKDASEQAKKQLESGDLGQDQYDALQREIIETEENLKKLEDQYKDFGSVSKQQIEAAASSMNECGEKISKVGDKITDVGTGLSKGVTAPIVAAGAASVAAWSEVDEAMDTVTIKTGATGEALSDMQGRAQEIAKTIPVSFQTAADAVGEVNTRFGVTGDELQDLSTKFAEFSELNGTDVSNSIDVVQSALAAFGLSAEDAGDMLDTLNKAGQDTGISVDNLASLMTTNAASLKEMGYSASDSAMLLANLSKCGVDTSAAMTGLKKAYKESVDEGIPMSEMLGDLQDRLLNTETNAEATADAMDIFGSRAGGALVSAVEEGRLSFDALGTSLSDYAGNVESTFNETLDPLDSMTTVLNNLKSLGADIVDTAGPMITEVLQGLADIVHSLVDAWNGLTEGQQAAIVKFASIAAVVGPVIVIIGKVVSGVGSIISGISSLSGVLTLLSGPVGIAIAIIGALVAAGVALYQNWDIIKLYATEIWNGIVSTFTSVKDSIVSIFTNIKNWILTTWDNIKTSVTTKVTSVAESIKSGFNMAVEFIKSLPSKALTWGKDLIMNFVNGIKSKIQSVVDAVSNVAGKVKDFLGFSEPDKGPLSKFHTFAPDMIDLFNKGIMESMPALQATVNTAASAIDSGMNQTTPTSTTNQNYTSSVSGVNINVYGAEGQDVNDLAQKVSDQINNLVIRKGAAWA